MNEDHNKLHSPTPRRLTDACITWSASSIQQKEKEWSPSQEIREIMSAGSRFRRGNVEYRPTFLQSEKPPSRSSCRSVFSTADSELSL